MSPLKTPGTRHRLNRLLHTVPIGLPRIRDTLRSNGATQVVAKHVVLGVIAAGKGQYLGVSLDSVVRLNKGLHRNLPVAGNLLLHVERHVSVFRGPALKMLGQDRGVFFKGRRIQVHIDEHPATPSGHLHLGQRQLCQLRLIKLPVAVSLFETAIQMPAETVVRAP